MKYLKVHIVFVCCFILVLSSCEKGFISKNEENSALNNFNKLWNDFDEGYVYFDHKNVDWDSVKTAFEPMIYDGMSEDELFQVFTQMLETLQDGHVSIRRSPVDSWSYDYTYGYQPNFNKEFVINQYLIPNDMDTTSFVRHCFLDGDIGYLYYSTFTNEITLEGMNEMLTKYENTKGLIIDVRGNRGGDASNVTRLMEHFVSQSTLVGYVQEKSGSGHNELGEKTEVRIEPKGIFYDKPIIILTNRECYSACNAFIAYMSQLSNVTTVGDVSGGGAGFPVSNQLWNGWYFTYSATIGMLPDGFVFENGLTSDVPTYTDGSFESLGVDNIIETAILELQ